MSPLNDSCSSTTAVEILRLIAILCEQQCWLQCLSLKHEGVMQSISNGAAKGGVDVQQLGQKVGSHVQMVAGNKAAQNGAHAPDALLNGIHLVL